ncbi:MAG TPA: ribonuclease III [Gaiellaceae bacterium]|nr:ribonuclease III [Gaiellaceae bacterium]
MGPGPDALRKLIDALPAARLEHVFTHASWATERADSYERLEFLGDSVLELAVARALYERYPDFPEGRLAKIRSHVVSRQSCAEVARSLGLGSMLASRGGEVLPADELDRLVANRNVLAALLEAALAAAFLEWGFERVEPAVVAAFSEQVDYAATQHVDHKTELQELLARRRQHVAYTVVDAEGPAHDRRFTCAAVIDGVEAGTGSGRTKKEAEQEAAREALVVLEDEAARRR